MNEEKLQELLQLYVIGETNEDESLIVENYLLESDAYRQEYEILKKMQSIVTNSREGIRDEKVLIDSRRALLNKIKTIEKEESAFTRLLNQFNSFLTGGYRPALSAAFTLVIGMLAGYLIFSSPESSTIQPVNNTSEINLDALENKGVNISNIRFNNPLGDDGEIAISFDMIKPVNFTGNIKDPRIQNLLTTALTTSDNAGVRIRTVNTLSANTEAGVMRDSKIKSALIAALKTDENAGVRREALNALKNFPYDTEIRDAYLFALANDTNPGIKVAAINALGELKLQGKSIDDELRRVIENDLGTAEDSYIKLRAASLIQEVN